MKGGYQKFEADAYVWNMSTVITVHDRVSQQKICHVIHINSIFICVFFIIMPVKVQKQTWEQGTELIHTANSSRLMTIVQENWKSQFYNTFYSKKILAIWYLVLQVKAGSVA